MLSWIAVFVGGGLGSCCRFGLSQYVDSSAFPWATLAANALACFVLGLATGYSSRYAWPASWKILAATGFCGGFSTFSTFTGETLKLAKSGLPWTSLGYVWASLIIGITALYIGLFVSSN